MKVLLSIKPEFVEKIMDGNKQYEYRKRIFKKEVDTVIVYASKPMGLLVGEFKIEKIINDDPKCLWEKTKKLSGISEEFFLDYFEGKDEAYAIKIEEFIPYKKPIDPYEEFDNFNAPQSYKYVEE